jgi:hypothetical protein
LRRTYQFLVYAEGDAGQNINTVQRNRENSSVTSNDDDLEVPRKPYIRMFTSRKEKVWQNRSLTTANKSLENVVK